MVMICSVRTDLSIEREAEFCYMSEIVFMLSSVNSRVSARFPEQAWCYFLDANKHKCYL